MRHRKSSGFVFCKGKAVPFLRKEAGSLCSISDQGTGDTAGSPFLVQRPVFHMSVKKYDIIAHEMSIRGSDPAHIRGVIEVHVAEGIPVPGAQV